MANNNNDTWKQILHIIITILTALATALTTQSCIKHRRQTDNLPIAQPTVKMTALASTSALSLMEQPAAYLLICYGRDTLAIPLNAAVLNHGISLTPATGDDNCLRLKASTLNSRGSPRPADNERQTPNTHSERVPQQDKVADVGLPRSPVIHGTSPPTVGRSDPRLLKGDRLAVMEK